MPFSTLFADYKSYEITKVFNIVEHANFPNKTPPQQKKISMEK